MEDALLKMSIEEMPPDYVTRYYIALKYCRNKMVLDVACGGGYGCFILAKIAKKVFGRDISEKAIFHAKQYFNKNNIKYSQGDFLNKIKEKFDVITCFETIEHIEQDIGISLNQLKERLNPRGILLLSCPNNEIKRKEILYHKHFLISREYMIGELRKRNFEILEILTQYEQMSWNVFVGKLKED